MVVIDNIDQASTRELRINEIRNHLNDIINNNECDLRIKSTAEKMLIITNNMYAYFLDHDHHRPGGILSNKSFWIRRIITVNALFFTISLPFIAVAFLVDPGNSDYNVILYPLTIISAGLIISILSLFCNEDSAYEYTGIDYRDIDRNIRYIVSTLEDIPSFFHFSHNCLRDFDKCVEGRRDDISCRLLYISCITHLLDSFPNKRLESSN